jgi:hypothetical protein
MDKLKNKYEIILGFVTLIISFSAFKDELSKIHYDLGYTTITASQYFLYAVYGFSFCLYLYILENIFRDTKFGIWNGWNVIISTAFTFFVFILLTPLLLLLNIGVYRLVYLFAQLSEEAKKVLHNFLSIASVITMASASVTTALRILFERKRKQQELIEQEEIKELDNATKLYNDEYYSQSILEAFKVLQTHLYREVTKRDIRVQRDKFSELLHFALKENVVNQNDIPTIDHLRGMQNVAAHTETPYTKENADSILNFLRELLKRNSRTS